MLSCEGKLSSPRERKEPGLHHAWKLSSDWPRGVVHVICSCDVTSPFFYLHTHSSGVQRHFFSGRLGFSLFSPSPVFGTSAWEFLTSCPLYFFFSLFKDCIHTQPKYKKLSALPPFCVFVPCVRVCVCVHNTLVAIFLTTRGGGFLSNFVSSY